ncbi:unnamed protein product [Euphydryas editha]|uniref:Uncharacterized protein n=1 Tax=Euphydryas editha TaxID=104508 RepID=A0AAU9V9T0_EUPED|nr:unnamed protein product [Euphydryas editha]
MGKTHLTPKKIHLTKKAPHKVALNTAAMRDKNLCKELDNLVKEELSSEILGEAAYAEYMWQVTKRVIAETAKIVFGRKAKTSDNWFVEYEHIQLPIIEQ